MSEMGLGCVKTKSDLVVTPSGGRTFTFFGSAHDHRDQDSRCCDTALSFDTAWIRSGHPMTLPARACVRTDLITYSPGSTSPGAICLLMSCETYYYQCNAGHS